LKEGRASGTKSTGQSPDRQTGIQLKDVEQRGGQEARGVIQRCRESQEKERKRSRNRWGGARKKKVRGYKKGKSVGESLMESE